MTQSADDLPGASEPDSLYDGRRRSDPVATGCVVAVIAVVALMLVSFFGMTIVEGVWAARLLTDGETVEATVFISAVEVRRSVEPSHYEFFIDGTRYTGRGHDETEGNTLVASYLPTDPSVTRPADRLVFDLLAGVATGLVLFVGGSLFLVGTVRDRRRATRGRERTRSLSAGVSGQEAS